MSNIICFLAGMIFMFVFITQTTDIVIIRGEKDSVVHLVSHKGDVYVLETLSEGKINEN